MELKGLEIGTPLEEWEKALERLSEGTRKLYHRHFANFCKYVDAEPDELYQFQVEAERDSDPRKKDLIALKVRDCMAEMVSKRKAPGTARTVGKAVTSFFRANRVHSFKLLKEDKPKGDYKGQRVITHVQIRKIFDEVGSEMRLRNRAIIMVAKDTGLRVGDIALLDVEDYIKAREIKTPLGRFKVYYDGTTTQKMKVNAYIHMGPEAIEAVDKYLDGRTLGPMFLDRHRRRIKGLNITTVIRRLCEGLRAEGYKVSAHSLRKFHLTNLKGAGMPEGWVKLLQGKKNSEYDHPEQTGELTEKYIEAYSKLRIFGSEALAREEDRKTIRALQERLDNLEAAFMSLTPGEDASTYSLHTSGNLRPRIHEYPGSQIAPIQNDIKNGKALKMKLDRKTGKKRPDYPRVIRL